MSTTVSSLLQALECPVNMEFLTDPLMLIPCGHTISKLAAESIFGKLSGQEAIFLPTKSSSCPCCDKKVEQLVINWQVKSIVDIVQKIGRDTLKIELPVLINNEMTPIAEPPRTRRKLFPIRRR